MANDTLTAEQRATDLVNLIRSRMRREYLPITVLDDVAAALIAELDEALRANAIVHTEWAKNEAALLAVTAERDQWQAAHAERSQKVAELQSEVDALHARLERATHNINATLAASGVWQRLAFEQERRGTTYRARALALLTRCRQNRDNKFWAGECGAAWGALELDAEQMDKYPTLAAAIVDQITVAIDTGDDLLDKSKAALAAAADGRGEGTETK